MTVCLPVISSLLFDIIKDMQSSSKSFWYNMTVCLPVISSLLFDIIKDMQSGS